MGKSFEKLRLPTDRKEVILKTVTQLDDEAWLLAKRNYNSPYRPSQKEAPDYYDGFLNLRRQRARDDPQRLHMGIWDISTHDLIVFTGFVSLQANKKARDFSTVNCTIVEGFRERGYATTALQAIMKFGREHLDIETFKAVVPISNEAGQNLALQLGFELEGEMDRRLTYVLPPLPDIPVAMPPASDAKAA